MKPRLFFSLFGIVALLAGGFLWYSVIRFNDQAGETSLEVEENISTDPEVTEADLFTNPPVPTPGPTPTPGFGAMSGSGGMEAVVPGIEQRTVEFEYPEAFKNDASGIVRVKLTNSQNASLDPEVTGNLVEIDSSVFFTRYETHNGYAIAKITAPEFEVEGETRIRKDLIEGQDVEWSWTLKPNETGEFTIRVSIDVGWTVKPGQSYNDVPPTEIWQGTKSVQVNQVLGLISIPNASVAGTVLAVLGIVAQSPNILDIISFLLGMKGDRKKRDKEDNRRRSRR